MVQLYLCNKQNAGAPIAPEQVLICAPLRSRFEGDPEDLAKAKMRMFKALVRSLPRQMYAHPGENRVYSIDLSMYVWT